MNWIIEKITKLLIKWCEKNNKIFYITGGKHNDTVYLVRYIVWKSYIFGCLYIHRFMRSDLSDPHDHPWNFYTYVVSGGYNEYYYDKSKPRVKDDKFISFWTETLNRRKPGSLAYRKATDIHKVVVDSEVSLSMDEIHRKVPHKEKLEKAPLTICWTGKRLRDWGFWLQLDFGSVFIDWRDYLKIKPTDDVTGSE